MAERMTISSGERLLAGVMFLALMAGVVLGENPRFSASLAAALEGAVRQQISLGADLARGLLAPRSALPGRLESAYGIFDGTRAVPRVIVQHLPADFPTLAANGARKTKFLEVLLPLVIEINEEILAERRRLLELRAQLQAGESVTLDERYWLMRLAERYGGDAEALEDLLARVDAIPPSLALAQAAVESDGQVPTAARNSALLHIRSFPELLDAVRAYARNLDSHPAYRGFRAARAKEREAGQALDGDKLAGTLSRYSERGRDYVRDLLRVMHANALKQFDGAGFAERAPTLVVLDRG